MLSTIIYKYGRSAKYQSGFQQQNLQHSSGIKREDLAGQILPREASFPQVAVLLPPSNE